MSSADRWAMNYRYHYDKLSGRAKTRTLSCYSERHHVVPRCMGGADNPGNVVRLTAREHYVAHQLLAKIYPEVKGLVWAAIRQARNAPSSRAYGWLKERQAQIVGDARRGKPISQEHREKLCKSRCGTRNSAEHNSRIAAALRGKPLSHERREKISASLKGRPGHSMSQENKDALLHRNLGNKYFLGKMHSAQAREKMAITARRMWEERRKNG